jgi:hypothetical protein
MRSCAGSGMSVRSVRPEAWLSSQGPATDLDQASEGRRALSRKSADRHTEIVECIRAHRRAAGAGLLLLALVSGCAADATSTQVHVANAMRYPVALEYWAVTVAQPVRLAKGLDLQADPGEGSYVSCGSGERYVITSALATARPPDQTAQIVSGIRAFEHRLRRTGWSAFSRDLAERQYLVARRGSMTVTVTDIANSFDSLPPPTSVAFSVAGPCTRVTAALVGRLAQIQDIYRNSPTPPAFKI